MFDEDGYVIEQKFPTCAVCELPLEDCICGDEDDSEN